MPRLPTRLRTFFETYLGTCDIYVNLRGHLTGEVSFLWFKPRPIDFPNESIIQSQFINLATYTPPALLTRIHYVIPPVKPEQATDTPTLHIPIRPRAPCS